MAECVPFLKVAGIQNSIEWFESLGFTCEATNRIWEPEGELNWARISWDGAAFMIGIEGEAKESTTKDASLWFNIEDIDPVIVLLEGKGIWIEIEPETFYGRKVVSFQDINGFTIAFSSALPAIEKD